MPDVTNAERAYREDPTFRHVVRTMEAFLHDARLTPHEMRAAATLACIHYEYQRGGRFLIESDPGAVNRITAAPPGACCISAAPGMNVSASGVIHFSPGASISGGDGSAGLTLCSPITDTQGGPDKGGIKEGPDA